MVDPSGGQGDVEDGTASCIDAAPETVADALSATLGDASSVSRLGAVGDPLEHATLTNESRHTSTAASRRIAIPSQRIFDPVYRERPATTHEPHRRLQTLFNAHEATLYDRNDDEKTTVTSNLLARRQHSSVRHRRRRRLVVAQLEQVGLELTEACLKRSNQSVQIRKFGQ